MENIKITINGKNVLAKKETPFSALQQIMELRSPHSATMKM